MSSAEPDCEKTTTTVLPEFKRGNTVAYLDQAPPLDAQASSYYAISPPPRDWDRARAATYMREYNRHMLPILTIADCPQCGPSVSSDGSIFNNSPADFGFTGGTNTRSFIISNIGAVPATLSGIYALNSVAHAHNAVGENSAFLVR